MSPTFSSPLRLHRRLRTAVRVLLGTVTAAALASSPFLPSVRAKGEPATLTPGKFKDWHGDVDQLEVLQPFRLADYRRVAVTPLDSHGLAMPTDNTLAPTQAALSGATGPFVQGLQARLAKTGPIAVTAAGAAPGKEAGTLIVRGRLTHFNPGSRAARYWGGFGTGAAEVQVTGEVADARTGRVLLRFVQQRRSGVGVLGGGYVDLLNRSLGEIGEDVGAVLAAAR